MRFHNRVGTGTQEHRKPTNYGHQCGHYTAGAEMNDIITRENLRLVLSFTSHLLVSSSVQLKW